MQIAAQDAGRLSRLTAGCAGLAVAVLGAASLARSASGAPPGDLQADPAAALVPAGLALLLQVLPVHHGRVGRAVRTLALLLALGAAALGAAALDAHPAAAVATALAGLALACLDLHVVPRSPDAARYRVADPLIAGAATIALVALVPRMFDPSFPARPGTRRRDDRVRGGSAAHPGTRARCWPGPSRDRCVPRRPPGRPGPYAGCFPVLIAVPVIAALVSALAARTGISRPAAAVSTGAILAALAVLGLAAHLVRTLDRADRRQRRLVDELHERQEFAAHPAAVDERGGDGARRQPPGDRRQPALAGAHRARRRRADPLRSAAAATRRAAATGCMPRVDGTEVPVLATMATIPDEQGAPRGVRGDLRRHRRPQAGRGDARRARGRTGTRQRHAARGERPAGGRTGLQERPDLDAHPRRGPADQLDRQPRRAALRGLGRPAGRHPARAGHQDRQEHAAG